MKVRFG